MVVEPMTLPTKDWNASIQYLRHCFLKSGGYRSRTDDPLRARQML